MRDAREVVPYGYAATYPFPPPNRRRIPFVARLSMRFNLPVPLFYPNFTKKTIFLLTNSTKNVTLLLQGDALSPLQI